jgi:hypothetical protein
LLFSFSRRLLAATLMLALNNQCFATLPVGTVYATGHVEVDGIYVQQSTVLVDGQAVKTTTGSKAMLQIPKSQSSVVAFENTSLKINHIRLVTLLEGGLSVDTALQTRTNIGPCAWVMPWDQKTTKYEIKLQGSNAIVYAYGRPVTLRNDFSVVELHPNEIGFVENYGSPECRVSYYQAPPEPTPYVKPLVVGAMGISAALPWILTRNGISADAP